MKKLMLVTLFSLLCAASAQAEANLVLCGEGREQGASEAEFALVDDPEGLMKFQLRGEALAEDAFDLMGREGAWIATVYGSGPGKPDRKFVFDLKKKSVQESLVQDKGEKKIGKPKPCEFID